MNVTPSIKIGTRDRLALWVIGLGVTGITVTSVVAISFAGEDKAETSRLVLGSVLPLLGTWVGTVLAFYFARENLTAATDSVTAATDSTERLVARFNPGTPVSQVMISRQQILARVLAPTEAEEAVPLKQLLELMADRYHRVPVITASGIATSVVHDSTIRTFAEHLGVTTTDPGFAATLGDLLAMPEYHGLVKALGFINVTASLKDARDKMKSIPNCNDVFVTSDGSQGGAVVGWLTNTLLASAV